MLEDTFNKVCHNFTTKAQIVEEFLKACQHIHVVCIPGIRTILSDQGLHIHDHIQNLGPFQGVRRGSRFPMLGYSHLGC